MNILLESVIYLVAALGCVPLSRWLGFGSVLGYLAAGMIIGPYGLAFISDVQHTLHFAELGVVFLLFIIGLELQPSRLWALRKMVFGLGAAQVLLTAVLLAAALWAIGPTQHQVSSSVVVGLILALSSTAFVLQMLAEKKQLTSSHGRAAFSILLFQDLAVIPLIALVPLLGSSGGGIYIVDVAKSTAVLVGLVVGGRYLLRPILRIAAGSRIPELFTATALLVVIGAALIMQLAGMSMVLGAFIAGILLADSEYRHQLEGDIAPFKGLLLGLFFIAVGMSVDIGMLLEQPLYILGMVLLLMLLKAVVLFPLAQLFGMCSANQAVRLAAAMSQGGEFAFVMFAIATREGVIGQPVSAKLTLVVTLSMIMTPLLYIAAEKFAPVERKSADDAFGPMPDEHDAVLIAGFGRFGQIVSRMLRIAGHSFTALETSPEQLDLAKSYGNKVHFGDATRLDVLRAAGAASARIFVVALSDITQTTEVTKASKHHFPDLIVLARARNRRHAHMLIDAGADYVIRETLHSSVAMGKEVLQQLGMSETHSRYVADMFIERDESLLQSQHEHRESEDKLIQSAEETMRELESLLAEDIRGERN